MPAVMKYRTTSPNPMTRRSPAARGELVAACSDGCMDACPPGWRRTAAGVYARPGRDAREDGRVLRPRNGVHSGRRAEGRKIVPDEDPRAGPALTKAGLYHHIRSKEDLLYEIMSYGMDLFEQKVLNRVVTIDDPLDRIRATLRGHVLLVTRDRPKEITVILHESNALKGRY